MKTFREILKSRPKKNKWLVKALDPRKVIRSGYSYSGVSSSGSQANSSLGM